MKINTIIIYRGVWGLAPQKQKIFFKKSNEMQALPYLFIYLFIFFFAFWQGSLYPQNYEIAP